MFEVEQTRANKHRHLVDPLFPRISSTTQPATRRYSRRRPRRPRRRRQRHPHTCSRSARAPKVVQDGHPFMHDSPDSTVSLFPPQPKLTFKIPNMHTRSTRSASRRASSGASGSEYHASEKSVDMEEPPLPEEEPKEDTPEIIQTRSGRPVRRQTYVESSDADGDDELPVAADDLFDDTKVRKVTRSSARRQQNSADAEDEDEDGNPGRYSGRQRKPSTLGGFIVLEDDEMNGGYATRTRAKRLASRANGGAPRLSQKEKQEAQRLQRIQRRNAQRGTTKAEVEDDFFPDHTSSAASADADGSLEDAPHTSSDLEPIPEPEPEDEGDGKPYSLRQRKEVNYAIPPPLEDLAKPPPRQGGGRNGRNGGGGANAKGKGRLGWSASGAELGRWMGMPAAGDDSVSFFLLLPFILLMIAHHRTLIIQHERPESLSVGSTLTEEVLWLAVVCWVVRLLLEAPLRIWEKLATQVRFLKFHITLRLTKCITALADADPLGVNQNVTFDEVGGLDDRTFHFLYLSSLADRISIRHSRAEGDDTVASAIP